MAVYTDVSAEDLGRFLAGYDLGELLSYKLSLIHISEPTRPY